MTGRGINTVRIGDEVKHITELDALTLMHEWSKLTKENADLYDYNRQVYINCLIFNIKRIKRSCNVVAKLRCPSRGCGCFPGLLCCDPKMLPVLHRTHCT